MLLLPVVGTELPLITGSEVSTQLRGPLEEGLVPNLGHDLVDRVLEDHINPFCRLLALVTIVILLSRLLTFVPVYLHMY